MIDLWLRYWTFTVIIPNQKRKGVCQYKDIQIITRRLVFVLLFWSSCIQIIMGQYLFLYNIDLPSCDPPPSPKPQPFLHFPQIPLGLTSSSSHLPSSSPPTESSVSNSSSSSSTSYTSSPKIIPWWFLNQIYKLWQFQSKHFLTYFQHSSFIVSLTFELT